MLVLNRRVVELPLRRVSQRRVREPLARLLVRHLRLDEVLRERVGLASIPYSLLRRREGLRLSRQDVGVSHGLLDGKVNPVHIVGDKLDVTEFFILVPGPPCLGSWV